RVDLAGLLMATQPEAVASVPPISGLVPMIRVREVLRTAEFYALLGFRVGNYVPREAPPAQWNWAWLYQPLAADWKRGANLMLVRGQGGFDSAPDTHVVLYLYAADLVATREKLLAAGVKCGEIC